LGFDSVQGVEKPRSTISELENEVARLEVELARVTSQNRSMSDIADAAVERLTTRLATAIVEPRGTAVTLTQENPVPLTSAFFISESPVPYFSSQAWDEDNDEQTKQTKQIQKPPIRPINVSAIPRHIIDIMLKNYCEKYRPQYPAIEQADLYSAFDRVINNAQPSDFDYFSTYICLAISVCTNLCGFYMLPAN
jgi:hypothetical protein